MKKLRNIILACLIGVCSIFASGCYMTQAQKMKNVKGTYQLKQSIRTEEHFDKEDKKVSATIDEIVEEGLEVYLVVTGTQSGYYAYKSKEETGYIKEVELAYDVDSEDTNKYTFVRYKERGASEYESLGVTKNSLNFYRPAICTKLFGQEVSQAGYSIRWDKVDKATDLSFVKKQLGEVPQYTPGEWERRGIYETLFSCDESMCPEGMTFAPPYRYYIIAMDTARKKADLYYAEEGKAPVQTTADIILLEGWRRIQIGEYVWTAEEYSSTYLCAVEGGEGEIAFTMEAVRRYGDVTQQDIDELIASYTPQA